MRLIQVTLGSGATQVTPNTNATESMPIYCSSITFQDNAAGTVRVGDNTVSATRGILLASGSPGGAATFTIATPKGSLLSQYYLYGTNGQVIDVLYETI